MTGAPLPAGADAVLQAEAAEEVADGGAPRLRVREAVTPGRHVGRRGEDVQPGTVVLMAGHLLRPQDVAVLASLGASPVAVVRRPSVAILVTGDELLPCGARPEGFKIVDSNSVMLAASSAATAGCRRRRCCSPTATTPSRKPCARRRRTSCSCPAGRRWGWRTTRRACWRHWAN